MSHVDKKGNTMLSNMTIARVGKSLIITISDIDVRTAKEGKKVSSIATSHGFHSIESTGIAVNCNVSYNPKYDTQAKVTELSVSEFAKLSKAEQVAYLKTH
jgi:hypothetical protein